MPASALKYRYSELFGQRCASGLTKRIAWRLQMQDGQSRQSRNAWGFNHRAGSAMRCPSFDRSVWLDASYAMQMPGLNSACLLQQTRRIQSS
jgi:hypothetical protein